MGVIIKIREQFGFILVLLIALAIVAFLLMDALNSQSSLLRNTRNSNVIASVNGDEITYQEFENRVQEAIENYKQNNQVGSVDVLTTNRIRAQVFEELVDEKILQQQFQELGITVTSEELLDMIQGTNLHPAVVQAFRNPETGTFDPNQVSFFLQNMTEEQRKQWLPFEKYIKQDRLNQKYFNLVKKSFYVPKWQVESDYFDKNTLVDLSFFGLSYTTIPDDEITIADNELENYLKENKNKYWQEEETRTIQYIAYDIVPSAEDSLRAREAIEKELDNFRKTKNDSLFVRLNSDLPYDYRYFSREELESSIADTFFVIDTGMVIGPYLEGNTWVAAKLLDRKMIPDSVRARHIFLRVQTNEELNRKRAMLDSLKTMLENGADFDTLARQYSEDPATAGIGGDLGWVKPGELFRDIDNKLFYWRKEGDIFKAASPQGFHLVEITEATPSKEAVKVAFLKKVILPSSETVSNIYARVNELYAKIQAEGWDKAVTGLNVRLAENLKINDFEIPGLGYARSVVYWAFQAGEGEVSSVFALDDKYVIAKLIDIKPAGLPPLADVRFEVEAEVRKQKKAEILKNRINEARQQANTIEALADKFGQEVHSALRLNFTTSYVEGAGYEPRLVGAAFGANLQSIAPPIDGNSAVFDYQVDNRVTPDAQSDYTPYKAPLLQPIVNRVEVQLPLALKKASEVEDNRHDFYRE